MKIFISLFITIMCTISVFSQTGALPANPNNNRPQIILPDTARYQIVSLNQMTLSLAVKLDRYTGKTYQYSYEKRKWYLLEVRGGLPNSSAADRTPKYQIYDEGEFIFLINDETGQSWIFNVRTWEPVTD